MKKQNVLKILGIIAIAALFIGFTVWIFPYVLMLREAENRAALGDFIDSFGFFGVVITLLIQIIQVIFAVIPGEPIEILAGVLYGTFGGLAICLAGVFIASAGIFFVTNRLGKKYIDRMLESEKYKKLKFLSIPARRDMFMFILYAIPGTPKDLLTYFAPCTGISPLKFLIICTFSRIPSVISSTYVGASFSNGNIILSLSVLILTVVIGVIGIWINNIFMEKRQKEQDEADINGNG